MKFNKISISRIYPHPIPSSQERLLVWKIAHGAWKSRKPDPLKELVKIRMEWERKPIPSRSTHRVHA